MHKIHEVALIWVSVIAYALGFFVGVTNLAFTAFIGGFALVSVIIIALIILKQIKTKILRNENTLTKKVLTTKTETGYSLKSEDIHEAIIKLGYYEHEMGGKV